MCPHTTKNTESCHVYAEAAEADGMVWGHLWQGRCVPCTGLHVNEYPHMQVEHGKCQEPFPKHQ